MNYRDYYLHGTGGMRGLHCAFNRIEQILNSQKIDANKTFNNMDQKYINHGKRIYLCDTTKPIITPLDSSQNLYIARGPSLVLKRNFPVITPVYSQHYEQQGLEWTNLYDEVRVDTDISLIHLVAITLPLELFLQQYQVEIFLQSKMESINYSTYRETLRNVVRPALERISFIKKAYEAGKNFDSNLPIIDFQTGVPITDELIDQVEEIIRSGKILSKTYFLKAMISHK